MKTKLTLLFLLLISSKIFSQSTLHVPADFATIQAAITASQDGDTVLVQPGEYFENLRFHGKSIVLTSRFHLTGSAGDIANTIINGSQPAHPDTASCILIIDGESPATVVQGFTITGGGGTKWLDEHGAGTYREGGGILTAFTSPTIQFNIIRNNSVTVTGSGVASTGGGGMRCGDGSPVIRNNWIHNNEATGYGGGIVLNYCTGKVHNNVVSFNEGGLNFGGGGLWLNGENNATVVEVFNNTVVFNKSTGSGTYGGKGGGVFVFGIKMDSRNNIFWANTQSSGGVFAALLGGMIVAKYSDMQGGFTGTGNFDLDPLFADTLCFSLKPTSPAIDAGDPNDNDLNSNGLQPIFPGLCGLRSDAGATGGQWASVLPCGLEPTRLFSKITEGALATTPADSRSVNFVDVNNDGWDDIFITNGPQAGAVNFLYLNDETGKFSAVTNGDIVSHAKPFDGATFADADNDGDLDAYAV
ncbi:MAG: VCBS repeat-containing protein, partial [Bacteroidota bacterium]